MKACILCFFIVFLNFGYSQKDSSKVKDLLDLAYKYEKTSLDSTIFYYNKAEKLANGIGYWIGAGRATSYAGIVFSDYGLHDSAVVYHKKSIPYYEKADFSDGVASSLINLGNVYQFKGDYEASTNYYFKGIEAYEKMRDTVRLIYAYGNFASLFTDFKIFDKSKYYQTKALKFSHKIHDSLSIGYLLNDLGSTYLSLQQKDSALLHFEKAKKLAEKLYDDDLEYYINTNLSNYHLTEQNLSDALNYSRKTYQIAKQLKRPYYECHALNTLGLVHLKLKHLDSANHYVKMALAIGSKINAKEFLMNSYHTLNQIHYDQDNFKEAFKSLQLYNQYRDSVIGQQQQEYISKLEQQYQVKDKDNEILMQKLIIEQNEALIQRKRNENGLYLLGLLIFLFTSFLFWYRHRQKQKLHLQKIQTLNKQKELASLEALIEGEDLERTRIAKDLHDSVNGNLSAVKHNLSSISKNRLKTQDNEVFNVAIEMLDNACEQIRNISHDLVPPSLLNYGLLEAMEQYVHRVNALGLVEISFQHFGTLYPITKKTETIIYHIVQELVTNVIKHSKAKKALVQINAKLNSLHLTVEDDGMGYDTSITSHGLGLQSIKSRVEFLAAEMDIKSDKNGTSVTIEINLPKQPKP